MVDEHEELEEVDDSSFDLAKGQVKRAWTMAKVGLGISNSYLGYQVQKAFLNQSDAQNLADEKWTDQAVKATKALKGLKGPWMKLGQMMSMQGQWLPEEAIAELATLQMHAPSMNPTMARLQFKKVFGQTPESVFTSFDPQAFASASMGQVHHATLKNGQPVVVKLQYPGIRQVIQNDLQIIRTTFKPMILTKHYHVAAFEELERGLMEETDYMQEAKNIALFAKGFENVEGVSIPKVYKKYSNEKVLTMSVVPGMSLETVLKKNNSQTFRNQLGAKLLTMYHHQIHHMGYLHADPHLGNYLFDEQGHIGLVDFGCVKAVPKAMIEAFISSLSVDKDQDQEAYKKMVLEAHKAFSVNELTDDQLAVHQGFSELYAHIYPRWDTEPDRVVDFSDGKILTEFKRLFQASAKAKIIWPELTYIMRAEIGLYNLLYTLKAKVKTSPIIQRFIEDQVTS